MSRFGILYRRAFASSAIGNQIKSVSYPVERIPLLEELFEAPVLRTKEMRAESIAELKGFIPPVLPSQIETSLTAEFGHPILQTDWTAFKDPLDSWEQAARLLHRTLAIYSNVLTKRDWKEAAQINEAWIREECEKLTKEIREGDYSRWESIDSIVGAELLAKLSPAQLEAVRPAALLLGRNPHLHPKLKHEIMQEICDVVASTITEQ